MSRVALAVRMTRDRAQHLSPEQAQARLCIVRKWRQVQGVECRQWPAERIHTMVTAVAHGQPVEAVAARLGCVPGDLRRKLFSVCDAALGQVYGRS